MAGSGTTLDVARELDRRALGYDLAPVRPDVFKVDARKLPPELTGKVQIVFIDPPYSTHLDYSPDPRCIGKLDATSAHDNGQAYFAAMDQVLSEAARVLKPGGTLAIYVSDSYHHARPPTPPRFAPIAQRLWTCAEQAGLVGIDWIAVIRQNANLNKPNFHKAAQQQGFLLRGFNHLLLLRKPSTPSPVSSKRRTAAHRPSTPQPRKATQP